MGINYEKKYKEAIERAKGFKTDSCKDVAEYIFPELKESEDEKIRKYIIWHLKHTRTYLDNSINNHVEEAIAWLEKQDEQKSQGKSSLEVWKDMRFEVYQQASGNRHEPNYSDDSTKMFSLNDIDEIFEKVAEKQGEQNLFDKVEPKFKIGDWIVQENIGVYKVTEICETWYEVIDAEDNHYSISFDKEYMCHLWTIQDAKDGDVLVSVNPFIFKGFDDKMHPNNPTAYCGIHTSNNFIIYHGKEAWTNHEVHPATKNEADFLFQKMKEAGYEWDAKKKELKKIEQNNSWSEEDERIRKALLEYFGEQCDMSNWNGIYGYEVYAWLEKQGEKKQKVESTEHSYITPNSKFFQWIYDRLVHVYNENPNIDYMLSLKERIEDMKKPTKWSKEDEEMFDAIIADIQFTQKCHNHEVNQVVYEREIDWLKSIKPSHWKPSKEQMQALFEAKLASIKNREYFLGLLYEDLKKL